MAGGTWPNRTLLALESLAPAPAASWLPIFATQKLQQGIRIWRELDNTKSNRTMRHNTAPRSLNLNRCSDQYMMSVASFFLKPLPAISPEKWRLPIALFAWPKATAVLFRKAK
ncbi:hypothetical protein TWF730_002580 [Orbilia blumenaviensis]|uniref:Uncharacterized protein n=1 Tax=Orbilia blumenaviensis TaxID=1796055 RepID=A0AAV9UAA7_9PEZI